MSLTCNIDSRGKAARLIFGIVALAIGIGMLLAWALPVGGTLAWVITTGVLVSAGVAIFEARAGWCVVRALGIRTPI